MKDKNKIILLVVLIILVILALAACYVIYLNNAHSTFENYYNFRGCVELVNKTDSYGFCKLASGQEIKLVKYQDKWFLDGDLPVSCGLINCP